MREGPGSILFFLAFALIALAGDLATKSMVDSWLAPGRSIAVLGDYVRLSHVRNTGASFGLFPGNTYALIAVSSAAVLVVLYLAVRSRGRHAPMAFLGLILGGALGNLYDRVRLGEVVDFIDVGLGSHRWPVFNVADVAVTIGVLLMLIEYLSRGKGQAEPESAGNGGGEESAGEGGGENEGIFGGRGRPGVRGPEA